MSEEKRPPSTEYVGVVVNFNFNGEPPKQEHQEIIKQLREAGITVNISQ